MLETASPRFRVLVLHESGGHHIAFSQCAHPWLDALAETHHFAIDYIHNTETVNETLLSRYALFLQLDYPPYGWKEEAAAAFEQYIERGVGGWIGLHHASLLGEFDGYPLWTWFSQFLGGIRYQNYISTFARARVRLEPVEHPVLYGVPPEFLVEQEEWYTYNHSPRPQVQVLAHVDESTYEPDSPIKMGDHPVVWTNPTVPVRNLYIFMGHSPALFENTAYTTLLENAILWTSGGRQ